jgi:hypothetical protein
MIVVWAVGHIPGKIAVGGLVLLLAELIVVGRGGDQDHAKGSRLTSFACASVKSHSQNPFEYHAISAKRGSIAQVVDLAMRLRSVSSRQLERPANRPSSMDRAFNRAALSSNRLFRRSVLLWLPVVCTEN